jgi:FkbM family methyltransferase
MVMFKTYPQFLIRIDRVNRLLRARSERWRAAMERERLSRVDMRFEKIGSDACGWRVPIDLVRPNWIVYAGGVGEDITFDLGIIQRYGCEVFAFDPTPRAAAHVAKAAAGVSKFHFKSIGLWSQSTQLRFFSPRDPAHVSHSALNLQGTDRYFWARCEPLSAVMQENGHDRIDLLKIDVEGAEYEVLSGMLRDRIPVGVVCVEFDQPIPWRRTQAMVDKLSAVGYRLVDIDYWNFVFLHISLLPA